MMSIFESLTAVQPISKSSWSRTGAEIHDFTIEGLRYHLWITGSQNLSVNFDQQGEQSITNTSNASQVFATVIHFLIPYMNNRQPESFAFCARHNQPSRVKLYRTMVRLLADRCPDYTFEEDNDSKEVMFIFTRKDLSSIVEWAPPSNVFGLAKKSNAELSHEARHAIESWETSNWTGGALEQHIKANDVVAQEISRVFAPVRAALPEEISLYRGIITGSTYTGWQKSFLSSWSSDPRTAELFAGLRYGAEWKTLLRKPIDSGDIDDMVERYERTGFLKFRNRYYVRNKEQPRYYNIYSRSREYITDGDDLRNDLLSLSKDADDHNDQLTARAKVFSEEISRDRIIWITNRLNCKEFIVKN